VLSSGQSVGAPGDPRRVLMYRFIAAIAAIAAAVLAVADSMPSGR
jgi:hypothetical protein